MVTLADVAPMVRGYLPGIDWSALSSRGEGDVYSTGYIYDYMLPAYRDALAVRNTLDIRPPDQVDPDEILRAWRVMKSAAEGVTGPMFAAARLGKAVVSDANALRVSVEVFRFTVAGAWYTALYGAVLHTTGAIHHAGIKWAEQGVSPEEVEARITRHAVLVTTIFQGFAWLDSFGVLKPLKKQGLGISFAIAAVVTIGLVAALAVLLWFVLSMKDIADKNREIAKLCERASKQNDEQALSVCKEALIDPSRNPGAWGKDLLQQVALYGGIGLFGYAVVMSMPMLISSWQQSRAGQTA